MGHLATKKNEYWTQLAILLALTGGGFIVAAIFSGLPLIMNGGLKDMQGATEGDLMKKLLVPENAGILRLVQFLSTFFLFFLPAWLYARISHKKAFTHLGFHNKTKVAQAALVIIIMVASLPLVGALTDLTEALPFSKETFAKFKIAED